MCSSDLAGPEAFDGFIASLRSPLWMIINLATLALVTYHAITWFLVMPKTAPLLFIKRQPVPDKLIVNGALVGFAGASIVLLAFFLLTAP